MKRLEKGSDQYCTPAGDTGRKHKYPCGNDDFRGTSTKIMSTAAQSSLKIDDLIHLNILKIHHSF